MRARSSLLVAFAGLALGAAVIALLPRSTLFTASTAHDHAAEAGTPGERWACPMMDFIGQRPGNCPVCGMKMTRVTAGELTAEQQRRMGVETTKVTTGPARAIVRGYGAVRYDDRSMNVVIPRISGRVVKRHFGATHMGNLVRAGDPLLDLYSPEAFAAQGELAAAVKLGDQALVRAFTERFERWNLADIARAIINGAAPVDTVTIKSPFSGRVVLSHETGKDTGDARLPQAGEELRAESMIVRLADLHSYIVVVHVPETRAHWLREGQPARLATDDRGELPDVAATISWLAPELNLEIRAREVHLHLHDPKGRLLPGSLVNARFEAVLDAELGPANPADEATWGKFTFVPKAAVLSTGVRNVVWRVAGREADGRARFELAPVVLGPRLEDEFGNDRYLVRAGVEAGDEIATQGAFLVDSQAQLAGTPSLLFPRGAVAPPPAHQH